MKNQSLSYWLLAGFALIFSSCKKEDPLPAATRSGANTFGCKVNGKNWIPDGGGGFSGIKAVEGSIGHSPVNPSVYNVLIRTYRSDKTKIDLYLYNVKGPGNYSLNSEVIIWPGQTEPKKNYAAYYPNPSEAYVTDSNYNGTITITHADTIGLVVSGTFEFSVYDSDQNQTFRITDGRLDIDYKKQ